MSAARRAGFTLVEVLATLGVLAIGLSAVVAMVLGSTRATVVAADRNIATIILTEAIEDIQRNHLITTELVASPGFPAGSEDDVGLFVDTTVSSPWPNIHTAPYDGAFLKVRGLSLHDFVNPFVNPISSAKETMIWPPTLDSPRYGGPLGGPTGTQGIPYRVIYKLAMHDDWAATADSPFAGVYILTLAVYRDLDPGRGPGEPLKRYEQISDPMVLYLQSTGKL